jgi:ubiquinone/menaquinone biosynthesis C-methylase UbiE
MEWSGQLISEGRDMAAVSEQPRPHTMILPVGDDEFEAELFCRELNLFLEARMRPRLRAIYETKIHPQLVQSLGREPTRREIAKAMREVEVNKLWYSLRTQSQQAMYKVAGQIIERQIPALKDTARELESGVGSLTLDPELQVPRYLQALNIHNLEGGYHTEHEDDDLRAGAIYDRNMTVNRMGMQGALTDDSGVTISGWVEREFLNLQPKRILEMGCTVGHTLVPFKQRFAEAEVIGIDVAAPCLRYGHARAASLGVDVHFMQQNAESTNFADGSFDLVYSYILLHETSATALPRIFKECHRLLRPGGVMIHSDAPQFDELDNYTASLRDWDITCNNEPFMDHCYDLNLEALYQAAGFQASSTFRHYIPSEHVRLNGVDPRITRNSGKFFVTGAVK